MRRVVLIVCVALSLLAAQAASAGKGPFRYRLVGHFGSALTP